MKNKRERAIQRADERKELVRKLSALHAEHEEAKAAAFNNQNVAVWKAFQCGKCLLELKQLIPFGDWQRWREANLPAISEGQAQLYMKVARLNPKARRVGDLVCASIRSYRFSYLPNKDRPRLEDRHKIPRLMHHLTVVNEFCRWRHRREIGLITANPTEEARDFRPVFEWLRDNLFAE